MKKKPVIVILAVLAVAAVAVFVLPRASGAKSAALDAREEAMEQLGESIAKLRPKSKVLVLSNPFSKDAGLLDQKAQFERAGLRGLREGLGSDSEVTVVFPEIRPEYFADPQSVVIPADSRTPLSFLVRPGALEQLAEAHPECSVFVSLIGLPAGVDETKFWQKDDKRAFALLLPDLRVLGSAEKAVEAYERGKILAAVAEDAFQPGKPLVITRTNVRDVLERQPQALGF